MRTLLLFATLWLCVGSAACLAPGDAGGGCSRADECAPLLPAPCAGCPPVATQACMLGSCTERTPDARAVVADISIDRSIASQAVSLVHVVLASDGATGSVDCTGVFDEEGLAGDLNVWSAGYKSLSGGSFHPSLTLGRVPDGALALALWVTDGSGGSGEVLGRACFGPVTPASDPAELGVVSIAALAD